MGDLAEPVASSAARNKSGSGFCVCLFARRRTRGVRGEPKVTQCLGGEEPTEVRMGNLKPILLVKAGGT